MRISYFIPDWDDRVDPGYDFLTDRHTGGRNTYADDVYAHELLGVPPYDGILLSRAILEENKRKLDAIREAHSVHRYLRLPADGTHTVFGDCGAFTYWKQAVPKYQTDEVLAYYHELGFDLGASVDHLIFPEVVAHLRTEREKADERERRWELTVQNAREFLDSHRRAGYDFTPVGVVQGWDPASYQCGAKALVQMGYSYIAIGGLVRNTTKSVIQTMQAVHEVVPAHVAIHLFGVNRPEFTGPFAALGITSFDSASWLRRAWSDGRVNYFLDGRGFAAVRIPDNKSLAHKRSHDLAKADRLEARGKTMEARALRLRWLERVDAAEEVRREQRALELLRAYDRDEITLEETLDAVEDYARVAGGLSERSPGELSELVRRDYRTTLRERPWQHCECAICQAISIEVIVFRGNNRNRRRGFHNTWQLYRRLQADELGTLPALAGATQMDLGL